VKYRVVVLKPSDGTHFWRSFEDPVDALVYALHDAGHNVSVGFKAWPGVTNIIVGWNQLENEPIPTDAPYIVWQLEQLAGWDDRSFGDMPIEVLKGAGEIWDYDASNIGWLEDHGMTARYVPIGYRPEIRELSNNKVRDIDVLVAGSLSPRRQSVVDGLVARRANVRTITNQDPKYGKELAPLVARSKVVLNIHCGTSRIQEQVRIVPAMSQGVAVVSERSTSNRYGRGIVEANYADLVGATMNLLRSGWRKQGAVGYDTIRSMPMEVPGSS
jgi:hypothetical protein